SSPQTRSARVACMRHLLYSLDYPDKDHRVARQPDPLIVGIGQHVIGDSRHILGRALHPDDT
ncbi:MAG: hypothetical protein KDA43_14065, partial [Hyphomonas sp.]|nr:hypothetical protein [Hyphomonas sp.]